MALVRDTVSARVPGLRGDEDKTSLLRALAGTHGYWAVVALGRSIRELPTNPVFEAIMAGRDGLAVLERWTRLERFGHSRNRTRGRVLEATDARVRMLVLHEAGDGGPIDPHNDLFVWGLLVGVLERAGCSAVDAALVQEDGTGVPLLRGGSTASLEALPPHTATLELVWGQRIANPRLESPRTASEGDAALPPATTMERLRRFLQTDLVHPWRLTECARMLHCSTRQLQRTLSDASTSFREVLQRARVDAALHLLEEHRLSLTDIAFCTGFSDLAHFSRTFRKIHEVPPSAFRDVLQQRS